jgi:hypothetical protein
MGLCYLGRTFAGISCARQNLVGMVGYAALTGARSGMKRSPITKINLEAMFTCALKFVGYLDMVGELLLSRCSFRRSMNDL